MTVIVSVVIPNRNKGKSLVHCLAALYRSTYLSFEVIVVDDGSEDNSLEVARSFPCTLISLRHSVGAAEARNFGARRARGRLLFFVDSDCIVEQHTLTQMVAAFSGCGKRVVVGGTYTERPFDAGFFSFFQSILVHYSETKNQNPDYVATHALAMDTEQFRRSGGFARQFLPILEDVDFTHRLRRNGYRLLMHPKLQVQHDFQYGLRRSLANACNKARYWLLYSLRNRDLLADSGTASRELKINLLSFLLFFVLLQGCAFGGVWQWPLAGLLFWANLLSCRRLLYRFFVAGGSWFGLRASGYFLFVYPVAIWAGAARGLIDAAGQLGTALLRMPFPAGKKSGEMSSYPLLETRKP